MKEFVILLVLSLLFVIGGIAFVCWDTNSVGGQRVRPMTEEELERETRKFSEEMNSLCIMPGKTNYEYFSELNK